MAVAAFAAPLLGAVGADAAGRFVATMACEAFQSKNRQTNPGGVTTEPGRSYATVANTAARDDWVRIVVPGAPTTADRWVAASCGTLAAGAAPAESTDNLLALNWLPAFCETRPRARECRASGGARLAAHGLWPEPDDAAYCGVPAALVERDLAGRWGELPAVDLEPALRARLRAAMPGTASFLDRHEWLKHGSCYGTPEGYFDDLTGLTEAVNDSAVGRFFAGHVGEVVQAEAIRSAFDAAFGQGAGARVEVHCVEDGERRLVSELTIGLAGEIGPDTDPGALMRAARRQPLGCRSGVIDPDGLQ